MALTKEQREEQFQQADDLFFKEGAAAGFAKGLFFGLFNGDLIFPYPQMKAEEKGRFEKSLADVKKFCAEQIDPIKIDKEAWIPKELILGLGKVGLLGMTVPKEFGGESYSQYAYCKFLEEVGGRDASVAVFVNAHHSIGLRALILEGTKEQQTRWMKPLCTGENIAAFALTEPEAGSDAGNVQTTATPTEDGTAYILNGFKHYITNGGIADVLTVMAKTPIPGKDKPDITAFLVTPDMPGFEVVEKSQPKTGIKGTATGRIRFTNMRVPKENIFGKLGRGLKLALSVLNFGRTTFGATCTGAAKFCLEHACKHANTRVQFNQKLGEFEMVKKKLAHMAADTFAMECATYVCAGMIDSGSSDYMLETAMLKVFASDALWRIVNDTIQIYGGKGYFNDQPFERMMRDARINTIGEGANDVMRQFIAMYGLGTVGKIVDNALKSPFTGMGALFKFAGSRLAARFKDPVVPVKNASLQPFAKELALRTKDFGKAVESALMKHQKLIIEKEYVHERLADAAIDMFMSACILGRLDLELSNPTPDAERNNVVGQFFLKAANRRIKANLAGMGDNDDEVTTTTANVVLKQYK